ncbi:MAG: STAS/SEC14 domain-containing protein [Pseudomonadota bacterium]
MTAWNGLAGGVCWTCFHGSLDAKGWQSDVDHLASLVDTGLEHIAILMVVSQSESPTAPQRKQIADFMQRNAEALRKVKANAMVMDSAMARGALTALSWLFKKPFEEKVFSTFDAALDWLVQKDAGVVPAALRADLSLRVPADQLVLP